MIKKHIIMIIMIYIVMLSVCGCSSESTTGAGSFALYYPDKDNSRIDSVAYELIATTPDEQVSECMDMLGRQPENIDLRPTVSDSMEVLDVTLNDRQLILDFSGKYLLITGHEEILKRAAIVRTLTQIDGIDSVSFQVEGASLLDSKSQPIGVMTADMFIYNAGEEINSYERTKLTLYYADATGENLLKTSEVVAYSSNISMEKLVTEHIISGPLSTGVYPTASPDTEIISVTTKDGVCYVNLGRNFLVKQGNLTDDVVLYSLVNSLTELPNINKVQFMIDSETEISFGDHSYLNTPLERNLELVVTKGE